MKNVKPTEKLKEVNSIVNSVMSGISTKTFSAKRKSHMQRRYWAIAFNNGESLSKLIQRKLSEKKIDDIKVYPTFGSFDSVCLDIPFSYYK